MAGQGYCIAVRVVAFAQDVAGGMTWRKLVEMGSIQCIVVI